MRAIALLVGVIAAVAVAVLVLWNVGENPGAGKDPGPDGERIAAVERGIEDIKMRLERLEQAGGVTWKKTETPEARTEETAPGTDEGAGVETETMDEAADAPVSETELSDREILRKTIREEIKLIKEEETKKRQAEWKAQQPEEWEKEEFGSLAWTIHNNGNKLSMTDNQKRQYYTILKEDSDRTRTLWKDLKARNPEADFNELGKLYDEQMSEIKKSTKELVTGILTAVQQKKYEELCRENKWFK